jgi:hypothetical protein
MTIYSQINGQRIQSNFYSLFATLNDVFMQLQNEEARLIAFADADLESSGISANDLPFLKAAAADANGLANVFFTGTDPRNPGTGYVYFNSMKQILGP